MLSGASVDASVNAGVTWYDSPIVAVHAGKGCSDELGCEVSVVATTGDPGACYCDYVTASCAADDIDVSVAE